METDITSMLDAPTREFYRSTMRTLQAADVPFLVGGAYAFGTYTGIERHTKDFDIFVRRGDARRTLEVLEAHGYSTELTFPHWLGKAFQGDRFIDVIFSGGNGIAHVDDAWFEHATEGRLLDCTIKLCPAEEIIWSKAFVMERERFDGADIAHLIRARGAEIDWPRLLGRFGEHWRVLLSHLVMFGFVYPGERGVIPAELIEELTGRLRDEQAAPPPDEQLCRGTLVSRAQYLIDIDRWGYRDARLQPAGNMSAEEIKHWTAAIHIDGDAAG